jgi:PTS system, glucose subfamily, IIA component
MGNGFAIEPTSGKIFSPVSGRITFIAATRHAFGITTNEGAEIMVHLGIDTVELDGIPFKLNIFTDTKVKAGQAIGIMDLDSIKKSQKLATVMVVITNSVEFLKELKYPTGHINATKLVAVATSNFQNNIDESVDDNTYPQIAKKIIQGVGGKDNIKYLIHCITRLRFYLKDNSLADDKTVNQVSKVMDVTRATGQYQVVIGHDVQKIYDEIVNETGLGRQSSSDKGSKKPPNDHNRCKNLSNNINDHLGSFLGVMTGAMSPMINILAGAGIFQAILSVIVQVGLLPKSSGTYLFFNSFVSAIFYALPIFIGYSAAKMLKSNPLVLAVVGTILINPNLLQGMTTSATILKIPTIWTSYSSTIFPIIFAAWVAGYLERFLKKVIPELIRPIFLPISEIIILSTMTYAIVGPGIITLSKDISYGLQWLYNLCPALAGFLFDGVYQMLTVVGLHWAITPIVFNDLATFGHSYLNALISITFVAQIGAL